eukprot:gene25903-biopygen17870
MAIEVRQPMQSR